MSISGYKGFKDFHLPVVGQLNLITGKNNVGKTSLLEAVRIAASGGNPKVLFEILAEREDLSSEVKLLNRFRQYFSTDVRILLDRSSVRIRPLGHNDGLDDEWPLHDFRSVPILPNTYCVVIQNGVQLSISEVNQLSRERFLSGRLRFEDTGFRPLVCQEAAKLDQNYSAFLDLWDATSARPTEDTLIQFLQLLKPDVKRISVPTTVGKVGALIRRGDRSELEPMTRFGEGLTRLFHLGLALVNCQGGYLLVDEIENGIHYSLFPKVWNFLFESCKRMNVTLFATTHSHDAADSFARIALEKKDTLGVLTRLQIRNGEIKAVQFTEREAYIAAEEGLEVR